MFNETRGINLPLRPNSSPESGRTAAMDQFRAHFQRSVRSCVKRGFTVAECFGALWEETLEEIALRETEQLPLYLELLDWAKTSATRQLTENRVPGDVQPNNVAGRWARCAQTAGGF